MDSASGRVAAALSSDVSADGKGGCCSVGIGYCFYSLLSKMIINIFTVGSVAFVQEHIHSSSNCTLANNLCPHQH